MYNASLMELFPDGPPTVVSDSKAVLERFRARGLVCAELDAVLCSSDGAPPSVLLVTCDPCLVPSRGALSGTFGSSSVLIVPLLSFAADEVAIAYLVDTLAQVDFIEACRGNLRLVEVLERTQAPITVEGAGASMSVDLSLSLEIALPKVAPKISRGEWVSLGQFLELGLVPNEGHTSFDVNGSMVCDGIAVAHHRHRLRSARPKAFEAWRMLSEVRQKSGFPLELHIASSTVLRIRTKDGVDLLADLLPLTDEVFRSRLTEVAFASGNAFDAPDWTINSQLNEGAGGSHVALGTGVDAAHIDFVSSFATVSFA